MKQNPFRNRTPESPPAVVWQNNELGCRVVVTHAGSLFREELAKGWNGDACWVLKPTRQWGVFGIALLDQAARIWDLENGVVA